jgi:hypothetical protein
VPKQSKDFQKIGGMININEQHHNDNLQFTGSNKRHQSNNFCQSWHLSQSQLNTLDSNNPLFIPTNVLLFTGQEQRRNNNPPNENTDTPTGRVIGASISISLSNVSSVGHSVQPQANKNSTNDCNVHVPVPQPNNNTFYFGQRQINSDLNKCCCQQSAFATFNCRTIYRNQMLERHHSNYDGQYRFEIDLRADTSCCGKGFIPLYETNKVCDVSGFHSTMERLYS